MAIVRGSAKDEMCAHIAKAIMVMKGDIREHQIQRLLEYVWEMARIDSYVSEKRGR